MNINKPLVKRMLTLSSFLLIGVMLLTACNGAFTISGSANPNEEGGVDIVAGSQQQDEATQSGTTTTQNMDQTTLILIIVGAVVLILVLIMLVSRRSRVDVVHHD